MRCNTRKFYRRKAYLRARPYRLIKRQSEKALAEKRYLHVRFLARNRNG